MIYDILMGGVVVGQANFQIKPIEREGRALYSFIKSYKTTLVEDDTSLLVDRLTLKPLQVSKKIFVKGQNYEVYASYRDNIIEILLKHPDQELIKRLNRPQSAFDNDEVIFVLQSLSLSDDFSISFTNVQPASSDLWTIKAKVAGREMVDVPAGDIECYRVEVKSGRIFNFWLSVDKPHYLVKFEAGRPTLQLRKMEYGGNMIGLNVGRPRLKAKMLRESLEQNISWILRKNEK